MLALSPDKWTDKPIPVDETEVIDRMHREMIGMATAVSMNRIDCHAKPLPFEPNKTISIYHISPSTSRGDPSAPPLKGSKGRLESLSKQHNAPILKLLINPPENIRRVFMAT